VSERGALLRCGLQPDHLQVVKSTGWRKEGNCSAYHNKTSAGQATHGSHTGGKPEEPIARWIASRRTQGGRQPETARGCSNLNSARCRSHVGTSETTAALGAFPVPQQRHYFYLLQPRRCRYHAPRLDPVCLSLHPPALLGTW